MALALMAGWMRSLLVEDLLLEGGQAMTYHTSHNGLLQWDQITLTSGQPVSWGGETRRWEIRRLPHHDPVTSPIRESVLVWRRQGLGFCAAVAEYPDSAGIPCRREQIVIPYWSLVVPLTLLSAFLILWKPRKPKEPPHA
jgi:hypothetical protein